MYTFHEFIAFMDFFTGQLSGGQFLFDHWAGQLSSGQLSIPPKQYKIKIPIQIIWPSLEDDATVTYTAIHKVIKLSIEQLL